MQGRRREDQMLGDLPPDLEHGDYWKLFVKIDDVQSRPMTVIADGKLTTDCWQFYLHGLGIGTLTKHTIREHDDGTISVRRDDGSSNSILHTSGDRSWHGYIEHGDWEEI